MSGCVTNIEVGKDRLTVWANDREGREPYYELLKNSTPVRVEEQSARELFQALAGELQRMAQEIGRLRREQIDREREARAKEWSHV